MQMFGKSDPGRVRITNQDTFAIKELSQQTCYAIICDGMGGVKGGDVASRLAVETVSELLEKNYRPKMNLNAVKSMLTTAITHANVKIHQTAKENPDYAGMGTTIIVFFVMDSTAFIAHVGDSRAYVINGMYVFQLTRDHTMVQALVDQGKLSASEAKAHPEKNIITRALGVHASVDIDYMETKLSPDDVILLCTDGLYSYVEPEEIKEICLKEGVENATDMLIELANKRGGSDNITVVALAK